MILFFDTETTGLPVYQAPQDDDCQPHIVQLAALLTEDDGTERSSFSLIVRPPERIAIPDGAAAVHGITTEIANRCGVSPVTALSMLDRMVGKGEKPMLVAHNLKFDRWLIECGVLHNSLSLDIFCAAETYCTMEAATPIVNLPPTERMIAAGFNKPKPPKLEEAYRFFTGKDLENAHDAMGDVRGCRDVFFALKGMS